MFSKGRVSSIDRSTFRTMQSFAGLALMLVSCASGASASPFVQNLRRATGPSLGTAAGVAGVDASFDYVVVGGGTAGLTIAARLAENPLTTVAVIEAGGFYQQSDGNISVIPGDCTLYTGTAPNNTDPAIDWGFVTVPQAVSVSSRTALNAR